MKNEKNCVLHFATGAAFVVLILLGLACATAPKSVPVELSAGYRGYLQSAVGNERVIDTVEVKNDTNAFICPAENNHATVPKMMLGATYYVWENNVPKRHFGEIYIDQLLNIAKRRYPSEAVIIKNARTGKHIPTNYREVYLTDLGRSAYTYDCFCYYVADVVTTEPMPQPVTYSEVFTMPGATRNDIYRRARNWLEDNTQSRRIRINSEDFDLGRIRGTVTCATRTDQTYLVTSTYTIDVYDARAEIRFIDTVLQRTDPALQRVGNPEPIFLQSIADATLAELVDFSTTLRSTIVSR